MDFTKLKYYEKLHEKGMIENEPDNLDSIISTLEEKQFEYFKRLETTKDESRKDEINETLNMIDLQLKELAAIKTAVNAGFLVEHENKPKQTVESEAENQDNESIKPAKDSLASVDKKSKKGLIIVAVALVLVVAIGAFAVSNRSKNQQESAVAEVPETSEQSDSVENDSTATIGLGVIEGSDIQDELPELDFDLSEGVYIYDIVNPTLIDAGLQIGDYIISLNGERVLSEPEIRAVMMKYSPGDDCTLEISRGEYNKVITGKFVSVSDCLPFKSSGTKTFRMEGKPFVIQYNGDSITINSM